MKQIKLPISKSFFSPVIDMKKASEDLASSNVKSVSLGTIDFGCSGKDLDQARENGGQVIWCAICLEKKLESMLTAYLFPIHATQCEKAKTFFISQVIRADILTYAAKKNLALKLINEERLLKRRNKDQFSKVLKDAMDYRNAFAHGDIAFHAEKGCVLECWQGSLKREVLDDKYWEVLEECFKIAHDLSDQVLSNINSNIAASGNHS